MRTDPPPAITHLLYLHGFRSSPQSSKARQFGDWVRAHRPDIRWWCPQLPPSPRDAMALLEAGCADWPTARSGVIGSSLGGFYATVLAQRWGVRAVLLNPAINPARDLAQHIGETTAWHSDEQFFFRPEFIGELHDLTPGNRLSVNDADFGFGLIYIALEVVRHPSGCKLRDGVAFRNADE